MEAGQPRTPNAPEARALVGAGLQVRQRLVLGEASRVAPGRPSPDARSLPSCPYGLTVATGDTV